MLPGRVGTQLCLLCAGVEEKPVEDRNVDVCASSAIPGRLNLIGAHRSGARGSQGGHGRHPQLTLGCTELAGRGVVVVQRCEIGTRAQRSLQQSLGILGCRVRTSRGFIHERVLHILLGAQHGVQARHGISGGILCVQQKQFGL